MPREYVPHPRKLPSHEQAVARWVRRAPVYPHTIGEVPYQSYIENARNGDGRFEYPVVPHEGTSHAELVRQLMDSGDLKISAAHTVALGLTGHDWRAEGRKTVWSAELFAHRQTTRFSQDPTPVRGKLDKCISAKTFAETSPSIAVNLSALRSLTWSPGLRPSDILAIWTLVAFTLAGKPLPSAKALRAGFSLSRPHDTMTRIGKARFSVREEPAIRVENWVEDVPVMVDGAVNPLLLEHVKPTVGGQNYAYLELKTIAEFTATWQENAYRGILAAAIRSRNFWKEGGSFSWELSIPESNCLFQNASENYDRLRRERLAPLSKILEATQRLEIRDLADVKSVEDVIAPFSWGSRIRFEHRAKRARNVQGRPADGVILDVTIRPGNSIEHPLKGQYTSDRVKDRKNRKLSLEVIYGLGRTLGSEDLVAKRSAAAKAGWTTRRRRANNENNISAPPKRPTPGQVAIATFLASAPAQFDAGHNSQPPEAD